MNTRFARFTKTLLLAACLAFGCSSGGTSGCRGSSSDGPVVDSDLLGIYQIDNYQRSEGFCTKMIEVPDAPSRLALYSVPSAKEPEVARLVGQFCGSVEDCRQKVKKLPMVMNWSFFEGDDNIGWRGWGIVSQDHAGDKCLVEVQTHTLTSSGPKAIHIESKQVPTQFEPTIPNPATGERRCSIRDAVNQVKPNSPCIALYQVDATFETE